MKISPVFFSRRQFLYTTGLGLAASALSAQRVLGANDRIRIGFIGMGSRSNSLLGDFLKIPNIEIVAISDPDTAQMNRRLKTIENIKQKARENGKEIPTNRVDAIQDYRKLLERPDIDAVVIPSTPKDTHPSESVMHLGNASYRMGDLHSSSELKAALGGHDDLLQILEEQNEQLAAWGVKDPQYYCGKPIQTNPARGEVTTPGLPAELTGPNYRKGYEVPKLE